MMSRGKEKDDSSDSDDEDPEAVVVVVEDKTRCHERKYPKRSSSNPLVTADSNHQEGKRNSRSDKILKGQQNMTGGGRDEVEHDSLDEMKLAMGTSLSSSASFNNHQSSSSGAAVYNSSYSKMKRDLSSTPLLSLSNLTSPVSPGGEDQNEMREFKGTSSFMNQKF